MLLTFSKDSFVIDIIDEIKRTSFREDPHNRWKIGMKIHFWRGDPRNKRGDPETDPFFFGLGQVERIEHFEIFADQNFIKIGQYGPDPDYEILRGKYKLDEIARRDGFKTWKEMKKFFDNQYFTGKIIHWNPKNCIFDYEISGKRELKRKVVNDSLF